MSAASSRPKWPSAGSKTSVLIADAGSPVATSASVTACTVRRSAAAMTAVRLPKIGSPGAASTPMTRSFSVSDVARRDEPAAASVLRAIGDVGREPEVLHLGRRVSDEDDGLVGAEPERARAGRPAVPPDRRAARARRARRTLRRGSSDCCRDTTSRSTRTDRGTRSSPCRPSARACRARGRARSCCRRPRSRRRRRRCPVRGRRSRPLRCTPRARAGQGGRG